MKPNENGFHEKYGIVVRPVQWKTNINKWLLWIYGYDPEAWLKRVREKKDINSNPKT